MIYTRMYLKHKVHRVIIYKLKNGMWIQFLISDYEDLVWNNDRVSPEKYIQEITKSIRTNTMCLRLKK